MKTSEGKHVHSLTGCYPLGQRNCGFDDDGEPLKPGPMFVCIRRAVMLEGECVAVAKSKTFAKRIANALNNHKPNREGV